MIEFINQSSETPYILFKNKYDDAIKADQKAIEAISISSYSSSLHEVNSRYINLKIIDNEDFIFFSNYNSPKSIEFKSHSQICALIYWNTINIQIRIKAKITKTNIDFNNDYFRKRSYKKNALAISSNQSQPIESYEAVYENYNAVLKNEDLSICPNHWGGYSFKPYYFEFWHGHNERINKREAYVLNEDNWENFFLQP